MSTPWKGNLGRRGFLTGGLVIGSGVVIAGGLGIRSFLADDSDEEDGVPEPNATDNGPNRPIVISEGVNQIKVTVLAEDVVRLRVGPDGEYAGEDLPEYVLVKSDSQWPAVTSQHIDAGQHVTIATTRLTMRFDREPLRLTVYDADGDPVLVDYRITFDTPPRAEFQLGADEHIFGFGDKRLALDKRGQVLDLWNKDAFASKGNDSYKNIPFYWSSNGYGVYLHNWNRATFDVGAGAADTLSIAATGGEMDLYLMFGPSPKHIISRYTELTGRPAMLPRWVFGYHQGKASYQDDEALDVAEEMRSRRLPCDAIYYDDWGSEQYKKSLVDTLRDEYNMRLTLGLGVPTVTAGGKLYRVLAYRRGLMTDQDGKSAPYVNDEVDGTVGQVDFFNSSAVERVFSDVWKAPLSRGARCGMVDFGELGHVPDPETKRFPSVDRSVAEMHNVYSLVYAESLLKRAAEFTKGRQVGMFRAGYAGSQRVGWTWTADSRPEFEDMRAHLRAMICLTLSGFSTVGYDIGGWNDVATDELYARWFTAGMFNPFAWAHGHGDHEPYSHGTEVENICRSALERRYRLQPYLYSLHWLAHQTGVPMVRSVALETDCERGTFGIDDQFFLGPGLLIAPVLAHGAVSREVVLPAGTWVDYNDGRTTYVGPTTVDCPAPLGVVPVFARAGAIIPTGPTTQYTDEVPLSPLTLEVYPPAIGGAGSFTLYEDDGESLAYQRGDYAETSFTSSRDEAGLTLEVAARVVPGGRFRTPDRDYVAFVRDQGQPPARVVLSGEELPVVAPTAVDSGTRGWGYDPDNRLVRIRFRDNPAAMSLRLER